MKDILGQPSRTVIAHISGTNPLGGNLDCSGFKHVHIEVNVGASLNTNAASVTVQLSHTDTTFTTGTNLTTIGAALSVTKNTAAGRIARSEVDLIGMKRNIVVTITPGTTTNDVQVLGATALLCRPEASPIAPATTLADVVQLVVGGVTQTA